MYDDLVALLRKKYDKAPMVMEAADAIEELSKLAEVNAKRAMKWAADAEKAEETLRWIPVTEQLPEEWKPVLTYQPYENDAEKPLIRVSWYIGFGDWRECERAYMLELPVTHWQPLPKPPKEET